MHLIACICLEEAVFWTYFPRIRLGILDPSGVVRSFSGDASMEILGKRREKPVAAFDWDGEAI